MAMVPRANRDVTLAAPRSAIVVAAALATAILLLSAAPVLVALVAAVASAPDPATEPRAGGADLSASMVRTMGWTISIGVLAGLAGWLPGRRLAAPGTRWLRVAAIVPLAIPGWLAFYGLWISLGPGTALGDFAARHDATGWLREGSLALGLLAVSWPIVAWSVAADRVADRGSRRAVEVLASLDALPASRRLAIALREDLPAIARGAAAVAVLLWSTTVAFDLAGVRTFGFELRTLDADGAAPTEVIRAGAFGFLPGVLLVALASTMPRPASDDGDAEWSGDSAAPSRLGAMARLGIAVPVGLSLGPLVLLAAGVFGEPGIDGRSLREFMLLHGEALVPTALVALASGAAAALLAMALHALWIDRSRLARTLALIESLAWAAVAGTPVAIAASAMILFWNRPMLDAIYDSPAILVLGHLGRFGIVAAAAGWWFARTRSRAAMDLATTDAPGRLGEVLRAEAPRTIAAGVSAGAIVTSLSLGEVALASRLAPPGDATIATAVLNAIHYQRGETVVLATLAMAAIGLAAAIAVSIAFRRGVRRGGRIVAGSFVPLLLPLLMLGLVACGERAPATQAEANGEEADPSGLPQALAVERILGGPGSVPGRFRKPRALSIDPQDGSYWIVDRSGRVQRLDRDGTVVGGWTMPEFRLGFPTGITVEADGTVLVPDTHYHRVIAFDREGRELLRFGSYGTEPGRFIYPTDVLRLPDGTLLVSEYGGADRVQAFTPQGEFLHGFDGSETGERFRRPQSMAILGEELFIADSGNHRIVVTDFAGRVKRILGGLGREPGRLAYPYGLAFDADGLLLVTEFGNNRVQRLDPHDGSSLGAWGGFGGKPGRLKYPWAVEVRDGVVAVLDSGNDRLAIAAERSIVGPPSRPPIEAEGNRTR